MRATQTASSGRARSHQCGSLCHEAGHATCGFPFDDVGSGGPWTASHGYGCRKWPWSGGPRPASVRDLADGPLGNTASWGRLPGQTSSEGRVIAGLRERKRAANRAATVDAAYALFVERGYDRVTIGDICEAADIAPRTFFRYFSGKEDVIAEPFRRLANEILDGISAAPPETPDAEALAGALRRVGAAVLAERERLSTFLDVVRGSAHPEMVRFLPLGEQERDMALRLARRYSTSAEPDRRLRLLVAVSLAAYRVWFEDMIGGPLADPLGDLDKILRAVLRLADPADPAAGDNPGGRA